MMDSHAEQSNKVDGNNIPKGSIKDALNSESNVVAHESKSDKEVISSENLKISLAGPKLACLKKKLLVLDVNGVLADIIFPAPEENEADAVIAGDAIYKRPFCQEFLKFCFENFEVGIWSSRSKEYIERIVGYLMGDMKNKLLFCWGDSHCIKTSYKIVGDNSKPVLFKDLRKIWDKQDPNLPWKKGYYNESNTLLIDDSPFKALLNPPHTSVFPHTFTHQNKSDTSLAVGGALHEYISGLANVEDIPNYVKEHPFGQEAITKANESWNFYLQALGSLSAAQLEDINVSTNLNDIVPYVSE